MRLSGYLALGVLVAGTTALLIAWATYNPYVPTIRTPAVQEAIQAPLGDGSAVGRAKSLPSDLGL